MENSDLNQPETTEIKDNIKESSEDNDEHTPEETEPSIEELLKKSELIAAEHHDALRL